MENETKLAVFLFVLSGLVILGAVVYVQAARPVASPILPETCESLIEGSGQVNFVMFGDKAKAKHYADYISTVVPFSEFVGKMNFYHVDYQPVCRLYKGIAILCDSPDLKIAASTCPHDIILVIEKHQSSIRSSAKGNVISVNSNLPDTVVIHELGHAVAHLAEEYITNQAPPLNSKNCVSSCSKFGNQECFQGCSKQSLSRSIDKGVMRSLDTDNYGEFDASLIRSNLESLSSKSLLTGLATSPLEECEDKQYLLLTGTQQDGRIKVSSRELRQGCAPSSGAGPDSYVVNYEQSKTDPVSVALAEVFTDGLVANELQGELIQEENFALAIPVTEKAISIDLSTDSDTVSIQIPQQEANLLCRI